MPRRALSIVGLAAVLVVASCSVGGEAAGSGGGGGSAPVDFASAGPADEGIEGVESYRVETHDHIDGAIDYRLRPPPGGAHSHTWANCGFYDQPVDDEHVVHDLEHGAVWLAYSSSLDGAGIEVVHELARANPKVIATPYLDLPEGAAIVASAWARQLVLDSVDDPRLEAFVIAYQDGSQAPEAGVTCTGTDIGDPIP
jgi:hypothetical protein